MSKHSLLVFFCAAFLIHTAACGLGERAVDRTAQEFPPGATTKGDTTPHDDTYPDTNNDPSPGVPPNGDPTMPAYIYAACLNYMQSVCELGFQCYPTMAPAIFSVGSVNECNLAAQRECSADHSDDPNDPGSTGNDPDCEVTEWPPQSDVDACLKEVESATCDQLEDDNAFPACAKFEDPC
jgi:hypothetical protein